MKHSRLKHPPRRPAGRNEIRTRELERRLESVLRLNRALVAAEDECGLLEAALDAATVLTGALAGSFVPLDEAGEPLAAMVHGSLPRPVLNAWGQHLAEGLVRRTCGECQKLHADAGQVCPLLHGPFAENFSVYCLPLQRGQRAYGLLNIYFGPGYRLNPDTHAFLNELLSELGSALQVIRLRNQEIATLRQVQQTRTGCADLRSNPHESLEFALVLQERTHLAREIHDGLAQTLAYLKLQTAQMRRAGAQQDWAALRELLDQNYAALGSAYQDVRQVIDDLRVRPPAGVDWLEQVMVEFERVSGLKVDRELEPLSVEIPSEIQAQLVRIVQEAFNNIRKHAHARRAWVALKVCGGDIALEVGDDGCGFQAEDVPDSARYGLRGMRERADWIEADFQVISHEGAGTVMRLRLPAHALEVSR